MVTELRVMLEAGLKGKEVVAVAPDWPGQSRGAKTGEAAVERLGEYLPRYAPLAMLAGMDVDFAPLAAIEVVERYPGTGSTDFWGISFAFSSVDRQEKPHAGERRRDGETASRGVGEPAANSQQLIANSSSEIQAAAAAIEAGAGKDDVGAAMTDDEAEYPAHGELLSSLQCEWLKVLAA